MEQREEGRAGQRAGVRQEAQDEAQEALGLGDIDAAQVVRAAAEIARENPHAAIAGAFAIGYLLGGGLTPRLLMSLAVMAGRRYASEMARGAFADLVQRELDQANEASA